jgi:hypothetical protein
MCDDFIRIRPSQEGVLPLPALHVFFANIITRHAGINLRVLKAFGAVLEASCVRRCLETLLTYIRLLHCPAWSTSTLSARKLYFL